MSNTRRQPPRVGSWLLRHFGCSPNNDAIIGDLNEQYVLGRSYLWYWREVVFAIIAGRYADSLAKGKLTMKRVTLWGFTLALTFLLGFETARSPWIIQEEMPSPEASAALQADRTMARQYPRERRIVATVEFLQMEFDKAKADGSRERAEELRSKLEEARRHLDAMRP